MIELTAVVKTYGRKEQPFYALKGVDLQIPDGASVAVVGKSGSGKSTLMHVMSGLDRPQTGQVVVNRQDLLKLKRGALDRFRSEVMGFIFQAFFVQGNESCYDNVSLPLQIGGVPRSRRREMIEKALARVELTDKLRARARDLSGGQKQRLAIARAIVASPSILFADEPTGNLDSVTSRTIEDLLFELNREQGVTLVIVTHDHELAAKCDMRVHIHDGQIVKIEKTAAKGTKS